MGGDVETIKERLDIAEVVGGYVKLEKAGQSFKARCPFHNEKTPSFFVSPLRQSFYCFGCGAKGDIFTFVEQSEGVDFREALKILAERAGVELKRTTPETSALRSEKEKILDVLEVATQFFENSLTDEAKKYIHSRGISDESIKLWRIGFAPAEWRALYSHLMALGYKEELLFKAGLIKPAEGKSPYDTFRDRIIFPLKDTSGRVIAFSGRALSKGTEPKYLNSPDTPVFTKHAVLYGLDKAYKSIRRKDYAVLVEGQIDLVLSHQVGVDNTVASSGTAFTQSHLERLKKLSRRILLAFDGDKAGRLAAEKSAGLALTLGLEVKIARLPDRQDPAEVAKVAPDNWKEILRQAKPAPEHFLELVLEGEKDARRAGLEVRKRVLPLIAMLESSIERSHFVSLIAKRTGIKEDVIWEDLRKTKFSPKPSHYTEDGAGEVSVKKISRTEAFEEATKLLNENPSDPDLQRHKEELTILMRIDELDEEIARLRLNLVEGDDAMLKRVNELQRERDEEKRKILV